MEILLHDGKKEVVLRGNEGTFELCWPVNQKDKDTGEVKEVFVPQQWYSSVASALNAVIKLKLSNADIRTIEDMQIELAKIRKELIAIYGD